MRHQGLSILWKRIYLVSLLVLFIAIPAFAQDNTYTVQRGDNLYRIALRFGLSTDALAAANGITDPSHIYAGQELIIPNYDPTPDVVENPLVAGTSVTHIVQPG